MRLTLLYTVCLLLIAGLCFCVNAAFAHDEWANGTPIPAWVKASCCGPSDAHHLTPEMVTRDGDYYHVVGYSRPIPVAQAIPSQDGDYWIFYRDYPAGSSCSPQGGCTPTEASQSGVYCFFVPMAF